MWQHRTSLAPFVIFTTFIFAAGLSPVAQTQPTGPTKPAAPGDATATTKSTKTTPTTTAEERIGALDARTQRTLALRVALDRAGFSPGEIDAQAGGNTDRALRGYQTAEGLPVTTSKGEIDARTVASLGPVFTNPVASYAISAEDVAGPFIDKMPADMMDKAQLPTLAYGSIQELLGERFHVSPKLLQRLNPDAKFTRGDVIQVPNVEPFHAPGVKTSAPATKTNSAGAPPQPDATPASRDASRDPNRPGTVTVTVTDRTKTLTVTDAAGEIIFFAPVTTGSANDPLPAGEWKVNGVSRTPTFNYNPALFWDANPAHAKAKIAPGPNNPVGVVWIDLSKEHYGIHGTPEPSRIGHTESHGCIRLTNWDAMRVASLVTAGTKVILR